ncbi:PREDICTED: epoxide hydrolase 4-like [Priapulus caudatus]|uniref:Epoxide hydrolase 4-like n=1 Tax=Priapulus caudatus TaxID=37621 RepID=A0ABM1EE62_PRICU|nr:PREDICTED: epoxide hydrolase 4-like [Priapulus caudatus]
MHLTELGVSVQPQNGIKLHYVVSGNAHDPLMLMVHGFPECWYTWRHQILEFQKDYRVVAVDLRGYGDSDKPPNRTDYRAENITEDLKLLISGLGYNNCTLVAHDWGGVIAFMLAEQCPSSVNRLIVMNTTRRTIMFRLLVNHDPRQLLRLWYTFFFQCPYLPEAFLGWRDSRILKDMFRTASGQAILSDDELEAYKYYFSRPGSEDGTRTTERGEL